MVKTLARNAGNSGSIPGGGTSHCGPVVVRFPVVVSFNFLLIFLMIKMLQFTPKKERS